MLSEREQLLRGQRLVPAAHVCVRPRGRLQRIEPLDDVVDLVAQRLDVVARGLDAHEQAVEGGQLGTGRVQPRLERLHERRPRSGERIEHVPADGEIPIEQHLDELRDELAVVGMEPVHVLRAHVLGQRGLGPGELQVQRRVQLLLRDGHEKVAFARRRPKSCAGAPHARP